MICSLWFWYGKWWRTAEPQRSVRLDGHGDSDDKHDEREILRLKVSFQNTIEASMDDGVVDQHITGICLYQLGLGTALFDCQGPSLIHLS
jgi:hypothetical protein